MRILAAPLVFSGLEKKRQEAEELEYMLGEVTEKAGAEE